MAIITPYKAQQQHIEKKLDGFQKNQHVPSSELTWLAGKSPNFKLEINLHSFILIWSVFTTQSSENKHLEAFCYGFYPNLLWGLCAFRAADWHSPCVNFRTIRRLRELPGNLGKNASETSVGTVFSMHLGPCEKLVLGLVKTLILLQIHWYSWGVTSVWGCDIPEEVTVSLESLLGESALCFVVWNRPTDVTNVHDGPMWSNCETPSATLKSTLGELCSAKTCYW